MRSTLFKILVAISSLACTVLPKANAASFPRADQNASVASVEVEKRQSGFIKTSAFGQNSVTFSDIACQSIIYPAITLYGSGCIGNVASACGIALNEYAGVLNAWAGNPDGPGYSFEYPGYFTGTSSGVFCTIFFANPQYFTAYEAENFLENWDSYATGLALADALNGDNLIQICVELWDSGYNVAFAGTIFAGVGWGEGPYSLDEDTYVGYLRDCSTQRYS